MAEKDGMTAALEVCGAAHAEPPADETEQLDLLPLADPRAVDRKGKTGERFQAAPRGPGRPKGARNKRTAEMVEYLSRKYTSPLEAAMQVYSRSVHDLAEELGCDPLDAMKLQLGAINATLPYIHQRQPQAVDVSGAGVVGIAFVTADGSEMHADGGDPDNPFAALLNTQQNQQLIDVEAEKSGGSSRADDANALIKNDDFGSSRG